MINLDHLPSVVIMRFNPVHFIHIIFNFDLKNNHINLFLLKNQKKNFARSRSLEETWIYFSISVFSRKIIKNLRDCKSTRFIHSPKTIFFLILSKSSSDLRRVGMQRNHYYCFHFFHILGHIEAIFFLFPMVRYIQCNLIFMSALSLKAFCF